MNLTFNGLITHSSFSIKKKKTKNKLLTTEINALYIKGVRGMKLNLKKFLKYFRFAFHNEINTVGL